MMVALSVQTLVLMAVAYFLGAALACIIRRSLSPAVRPVAVTAAPERRVEPLPEVAARDAQAAAVPVREAAPAVATVVVTQPAAPVAAPAIVLPAPVSLEPQDLRSIQGIDAATQDLLLGLGVTRYEHIAAWTRADVDRVSQALGQKGRVARENWIEQAQILAKGGQTLFSIRRARGEGSTAAPTPDEGLPALAVPPPVVPASPGPLPLPLPMSRVGVAAVVIAPTLEAARPAPAAVPAVTSPEVADRAAFARGSSAEGAEPAGEAAVPIRPAEPAANDNLQRIGNITADIEQKLNTLGALRYAHIAQWSPAEVERVDRELGLRGRISRENWIEQAHILSRGGDTRFSLEFDRRASAPPGPPPRPIKLPDAIREHAARTDLGSLRSVRSEAYQDTSEPGPEAARRAASRRVVGGTQAEDLKRIRGIGPMIEKRLNALGVKTYEDIANWTSENIERISEQLDFGGRIQRENWVEQARILAAGGETEFSRRIDREGRPKT